MSRKIRVFLSVVVMMLFPMVSRGERSAVVKVGNDFRETDSLTKWRLSANNQPFYSGILNLSTDNKIPVQLFLFHNEQSLYFGIMVIDSCYQNLNDDLSPNFQRNDHLRLQFIVHSKTNERSESLLILPTSIFKEPIIVADYSFYRDKVNISRSDIRIFSNVTPGYYFITMAIPFTALSLNPLLPGNELRLDLELYKILGNDTVASAWISSNGSKQGSPLIAIFRDDN